jgi:hypothetical protein
MIELILLFTFLGGLVIGAIVANALGRLPSAEELQEEDRKRLSRYERSF